MFQQVYKQSNFLMPILLLSATALTLPSVVSLITKNSLYQPEDKKIRTALEKHYHCDYAN